jgi:hypothetical protein
MKIGVFAASALMGVATLVSVSFADEGERAMIDSGRTQANMDSGVAARFTAPTQAPELRSDRPPAGMLPPQQSGPARDYSAQPSAAPAQGGDIQQALRR